jgi:hypothetical protein
MQPSITDQKQSRGIGRTIALGLLILAGIMLVLVGAWAVRLWFFPPRVQPVVLDAKEQTQLESKLRILSGASIAPEASAQSDHSTLQPEQYVERGEDRVIYFTQRELNAMIARNPDLAERVALHLSDDLLSASVLITMPQDLPVLAGRTVKLATGLRLRHEHGRPVVIVEGVSVMGVPLPTAWLGGIKGLDLIALYGGDGGFWKAFSEGVRDLRIEQGRLRVELAE